MPTNTQSPYLTNTSTYVNIIYSENYSYVDLINLGIGAAGDLILENKTDPAGCFVTHGHVFHFIDPDYIEKDLEPIFDKRYVMYADNGVDVSIPGKLYTEGGLVSNSWYTAGVNNESHLIMDISTGTGDDDKYYVNYRNDVVLRGMDDIYFGSVSVKNRLNECYTLASDALPKNTYYINYTDQQNTLNDHANAISTLRSQMDQNFREDEERFNFHNQDVASLVNELAGIHNQIDKLNTDYSVDIPEIRQDIKDLTGTVAEAYTQYQKHVQESNTHFGILDSSVNALESAVSGWITDLSTFVDSTSLDHGNRITALENRFDTLDSSVIPGINSSIEDIFADISTHTTQITWLYNSAEQQDSEITKLSDEVTLLKGIIDNGTNLDGVMELIEGIETRCNEYTDNKFQPIENLIAIGIPTNEDLARIEAGLDDKIDTSVYAADVSVLTAAAHDLNRRLINMEEFKRQMEVDIAIGNIGAGFGGNIPDDLMERIIALEAAVKELSEIKSV